MSEREMGIEEEERSWVMSEQERGAGGRLVLELGFEKENCIYMLMKQRKKRKKRQAPITPLGVRPLPAAHLQPCFEHWDWHVGKSSCTSASIGYMSPEYAMGGMFSEKSDVYSFGVLLLEIISGKKNTSFYCSDQQLGFLAYTWHSWNAGRGLELVDEVLANSYSPSEVMRCVHIGLLCVQDNAVDRPTMPDVLSMLSTETDRPQPHRPIFTVQKSVSDPQPQYDNIYSGNEATITVIQGR